MNRFAFALLIALVLPCCGGPDPSAPTPLPAGPAVTPAPPDADSTTSPPPSTPAREEGEETVGGRADAGASWTPEEEKAQYELYRGPVAILDELTDLLDGVAEVEAARKAVSGVEAAADRMRKLRAKSREIGDPPPALEKKIEAQVMPEVKAAEVGEPRRSAPVSRDRVRTIALVVGLALLPAAALADQPLT
jgi:hypothetical protein